MCQKENFMKKISMLFGFYFDFCADKIVNMIVNNIVNTKFEVRPPKEKRIKL